MGAMISELLSALGAHFYLIMIGCIELVVAVFLLGILPKRRKKDRQSAASGTGTEQLIQTLSRQEEEVFLIEVYETQGVGKSRTQRIAIHYRFVGYIDIPAAPLTSHYISETRQGMAVEYIPA